MLSLPLTVFLSFFFLYNKFCKPHQLPFPDFAFRFVAGVSYVDYHAYIHTVCLSNVGAGWGVWGGVEGGSVTREGKYYCAKALYNAFMELAVLP